MLLENPIVILTRQVAAKLWADEFLATRQSNGPSEPKTSALIVLTVDDRTMKYLAEFDPQALKQAQKALNEKSWEDYLSKKPYVIQWGIDDKTEGKLTVPHTAGAIEYLTRQCDLQPQNIISLLQTGFYADPNTAHGTNWIRCARARK